MAKNGSPPGRRVAIVAGLRTPFVKSGGDFRDLSAVDLGAIVVNELVARSGIPAKEFDTVVFGQVIPSSLVTLIGREMVLRTQLPRSVEAHTVARACATSIQAATDAADQIALGHSDCAVAGGAESLSDAPIFASRPLAQALVAASRAKGRGARRLKAFSRLAGAKDLAPVPPALKEPTTGLTMGESAEKMAQKNGISREAQDALRLPEPPPRRRGLGGRQVRRRGDARRRAAPLRPGRGQGQHRARATPRSRRSRQLKPVFDRKYGTITAGNASPLTDGAAALILMTRGEGAGARAPAARLRCAPTPTPRSTRATSSCRGRPTPRRWRSTAPGSRSADMDLVDMHEAFAAQVLSNLQAFASKAFAEEKLGRGEPLGEVDPARLNVNGGSIALGHPFAATGARMITQTLRELGRRKGAARAPHRLRRRRARRGGRPRGPEAT